VTQLLFVYNDMKHINALNGHNNELLNIKPGGT